MSMLGAVTAILQILAFAASPADWAQFRGPNASGVSESRLPDDFGPDRNVVWRTAVPPGNASPVLATDRVFLTGHEGDTLVTLAVDRASGKLLWRREAPRPRKQVIERPANGPTSASPVTDGRNAYVFFQDFGLLAYGPDGKELWRMPLGPFRNPFGHGASPILAGGTLFMVCDQDVGAYLLAVDTATGRVRWRAERPHAQRGYATPILYHPANGRLQVIVAGSYRLSGYDAETGKEIWWIRGLPWQVKPTPVVDGDTVYFVTFSGDSEPGEQEHIPSFEQALSKLDANRDGKLSKDELVDPRAKNLFDEYLDLDRTGYLEERDWKQYEERRLGGSALRAYRLGGEGDLTERNFLWKNSRSLPNVPSPLVYRGVLYTLKEGGILTSYDPKTGATHKQARLQGAVGAYFESPIAADGKILVISEEGKATVIRAGAQWEPIRVVDLADGCKATPALSDGRMYLRTYGTLYCFGDPETLTPATARPTSPPR